MCADSPKRAGDDSINPEPKEACNVLYVTNVIPVRLEFPDDIFRLDIHGPEGSTHNVLPSIRVVPIYNHVTHGYTKDVYRIPGGFVYFDAMCRRIGIAVDGSQPEMHTIEDFQEPGAPPNNGKPPSDTDVFVHGCPDLATRVMANGDVVMAFDWSYEDKQQAYLARVSSASGKITEIEKRFHDKYNDYDSVYFVAGRNLGNIYSVAINNYRAPYNMTYAKNSQILGTTPLGFALDEDDIHKRKLIFVINAKAAKVTYVGIHIYYRRRPSHMTIPLQTWTREMLIIAMPSKPDAPEARRWRFNIPPKDVYVQRPIHVTTRANGNLLVLMNWTCDPSSGGVVAEFSPRTGNSASTFIDKDGHICCDRETDQVYVVGADKSTIKDFTMQVSSVALPSVDSPAEGEGKCTCVHTPLYLMLEKDLCTHCIDVRAAWRAFPSRTTQGDMRGDKKCYICGGGGDDCTLRAPLECAHLTDRERCVPGLYHCGICNSTWTATPDATHTEELWYGGPHRKLAGYKYERAKDRPLYCTRQ